MITTPNSSNQSSGGGKRWALLLAVLAGTLWAGLDPKDYRFANEVSWLPDRPGVHFGQFGRLHTVPFLTPDLAKRLNEVGFTVEIAAPISDKPSAGFRFLATFRTDGDSSQLVVGQWRQHLIVMNGDDYSNKRRQPRITADASALLGQTALITITTDNEAGTRVLLNGKIVSTRRNLRLTIPSGPGDGRLLMGNSVRGDNSWMGDVEGFALYGVAISPARVATHFAQWRKQGLREIPQGETPLLFYRFNEPSTVWVGDVGSLKIPLEIPTRLEALEPRILTSLPEIDFSNRSLVKDMTLNLLGFMPFGFAAALVLRPWSQSRRKLIVRATIAALAVSLGIEIAQAWMPSRDSSLLDLALNTAGATCGAIVGSLVGRRPTPRPASLQLFPRL